MAIQNRRGVFAILDKSKLVPGEFAVCTDNGKLYYCYAAGSVKELATATDLQNILDSSEEAYEALQQLIEDLGDETVVTSLINTQTEVNNARGVYSKLDDRIDNIDSQLAQKAKQSDLDVANANIALKANQSDLIATNNTVGQKANQSDLDVQTARIDSFTTLAQGSTTGDAELIDARVGADGITYTNAGESIRSQVTNLTNIGTGKNLYNTSSFVNNTINGVTLIRKTDGGIKLSGTATTTGGIGLVIFTLPVGNYLINGISINNQAYMTLRIGPNPGSAFGGNIKDVDLALNVTNANQQYLITVVVTSGVTYDETVYPMIRLSTENNSDYEPYGIFHSELLNTMENKIYGLQQIASKINFLTGMYNYDVTTLVKGFTLKFTSEDFGQYIHAKVKVNKGDRVHLECYGGTSNRNCVITDINNVVLYIGAANTEKITDYEVENDGYIYLNDSPSYNHISYFTYLNSPKNYVSDYIVQQTLKNYAVNNELNHADYIGSFNMEEQVGGIFIDDTVSGNGEIVNAYVCYMANPTENIEIGTLAIIAKFNLQEPVKRETHIVFDLSSTTTIVNIDGVNYSVGKYVGDPVIFNYDTDYIYLTFRALVNGNNATLGMMVSKSTFTVSDIKFITVDNVAIKDIVNSTDIQWSNNNIVYYNGYYYRSWRNKPVGTFIIRSSNLYDWDTWLDLSSLAPASDTLYDETAIAIDSGTLYFAIRASLAILGKVAISDIVSISDVVTGTYIHTEPTRPSIAIYNGYLWFMCTNFNANYVINGVTVRRANRLLVKMDMNFNAIETYGGYSPIGGNYNLLYAYKSQLFVVLNMNKQGTNNSNSYERNGVYFTPLYSICE